MSTPEEARRLISELSAGRTEAGDTLLPLLYGELRALAAHFMRKERPGHTLQTTALVHEAWLRVRGKVELSWEDQAQFLRIAARAMRQVLVDHARRHHAEKRSGDRERVPLEESMRSVDEPAPDLLDLDDALSRLSQLDERLGQVVELRYFAGLTIEETGRVLGVTSRTVQRDERTARAWLDKEIGGDHDTASL